MAGTAVWMCRTQSGAFGGQARAADPPPAHPLLPSFSPREQNSPRPPTPTRPLLLKPAHSSYKIPRIGYLKRKKKKKAHAQVLVPCCWNPSQHAELFYCLIQAGLCALVGHFPTARLCLRSASPVCLPHWWGTKTKAANTKIQQHYLQQG